VPQSLVPHGVAIAASAGRYRDTTARGGIRWDGLTPYAPMTQQLVSFTPVLHRISQLTSPWVALRLVRYFGGRRLYFPRNPRPDHPIAIVVGRRHFAALCLSLSGYGQVRIPKQQAHAEARLRMRIMRSLYLAGVSSRAIATNFGVSTRFVTKVAGAKYDWLGKATPAESEQFCHCNKLLPFVAFGKGPIRSEAMEETSFVQAIRIMRALTVLTPELSQATQGLSMKEAASVVGVAVMPILEEVGFTVPPTVPTGVPARLFQQASEAMAIEGVPVVDL